MSDLVMALLLGFLAVVGFAFLVGRFISQGDTPSPYSPTSDDDASLTEHWASCGFPVADDGESIPPVVEREVDDVLLNERIRWANETQSRVFWEGE